MKLQGEIVTLRAMEPDDADVLYNWENNPEVWKVSNTVIPYSKTSISEFIANERDIYLDKQLRLIIVDNANQKPVGCIDIFDFSMRHQRAGLGVLIANDEDRKKGFANDALRVIKSYAFEILLLNQLFCNVPANNKASIALFEKHGFIKAGVKKEWIRRSDGWMDEWFYQLLNQ